MKKLFMAIGLAALLAGCKSQDNNGMGGVSDDTMKTDSIHNTGNSSDQFNNNATQGTGTDVGTNSATGESGNPQ